MFKELETIEITLATLFGKRPPWELEIIYENRVGQGMDCILRATHPKSGFRVAVKKNAAIERNQQQFLALSALRAATPDCVKPHGLAPDCSFYVMRWIDAPLLMKRMRKPDRLEAIGRAGAWLRAMHDGSTDDTPTVDRSIATPEISGGQPCPEMDEVLRRLEERLQAFPAHESRAVLLHTDFQLHNLFDTGDRLIAFDPVSYRRGNAGFDISRFLVGLNLFRQLFELRGHPWPGAAEADREAFLSAYGPLADMPENLLDRIEEVQIVRLWSQFSSITEFDQGAQRRASILSEMLRERGLLDTGLRAQASGRGLMRFLSRSRP